MAGKEYCVGCPIHREDELPTHSLFYDEKCGDCPFVLKLENRLLCGKTPPRVTMHQSIRSQIGCIGCDNYTKDLTAAVCRKCLQKYPNATYSEMIERNMGKKKVNG